MAALSMPLESTSDSSFCFDTLALLDMKLAFFLTNLSRYSVVLQVSFVRVLFYHDFTHSGTAMPDRRGRKGSLEDLIPDDRVAWAKEIWAAPKNVAKLPSGAWMLGEAAKALSLPEEAVDNAVKR